MEQQFDLIFYAPYKYIAKPPTKLRWTLCIHYMPVLLLVHCIPPEIGVRYPDRSSRAVLH